MRTLLPPEQVAGYDRQVADFRATLAAVRVHRDGLPKHPGPVGERPEFLDGPIVTYLVDGLDAIRSGRVHETMPLIDLANAPVRADDTCTQMAELTIASLVERTRAYLDAADLPLDRPAMHATADALQFLGRNRVAELALLRRTEELGPLVHALDYGTLTFLTNLGFSLNEGRALNTVPLAEVRVEHAFDLATLTLDVTSLLLTAGNMALGFTGVGSSVTTPLSVIQTLAFSPATYGAPILEGVMQSMCAA
ncbi:hypothetical protein [Nocardia bhagyanarayanae]|uniref:hypothetical protein n=1 Tax=Nocardia bhagyanarayanae TaxID=1215925 RepID=UPI00114E9642|nr:hypothetical protein [Nocardia bhagyanarayanae]